ncbi:MAG: PsiF family protein [Steroidobacteraceae bacterium]
MLVHIPLLTTLPPSVARLARGAAAALALLSVTASPAFAAAGGTLAATVTARPPLEAVPAASLTPAQRARARECTAAAKAHQLQGEKRASFIKSCMTPRRVAAAPSR